MKLNNKGWGLTAELLVILVIIGMLIYSCIGLSKLNLLDFDINISNHKINEFLVSGKIVNYNTIENKIINAFQEYRKSNDTNNVRIKTLIENGYLETIRSKKGEECTGYSVYKNGNYSVYLKCGNYMTKGYNK